MIHYHVLLRLISILKLFSQLVWRHILILLVNLRSIFRFFLPSFVGLGGTLPSGWDVLQPLLIDHLILELCETNLCGIRILLFISSEKGVHSNLASLIQHIWDEPLQKDTLGCLQARVSVALYHVEL